MPPPTTRIKHCYGLAERWSGELAGGSGLKSNRGQSKLTDVTARIIIYQAFSEGELDVPKPLAGRVHDFYFAPQYDEFRPRTL